MNKQKTTPEIIISVTNGVVQKSMNPEYRHLLFKDEN